MEKFITYKGFKIVSCPSGYSAWGKSPFNPIDTVYYSSKSLAKVKRCINDWLKVNKLKKWRTTFPDFIAKDTIVW
jgi:hypothetical protein